MSIFDNGGLETFKFELLTLNNGIYQHSEWITNYVEDCNVNIDFDSQVIADIKANILHLDEIDFLKDLIKPYYCFLVNGIQYEIPLGHYMLLSPTKKTDGFDINRTVDGFDLLKALEQDKTIESASYASGENIVEIIESILDSVGTWVKYSIEQSDEVLTENISYELGKSKLFIINSLLNMLNYYPLWVTGNGVYKAIPWQASPSIIHTFLDDSLSLYENNVEVEIDYSNLYNRVLVINNQLQEETEPLYKLWTMEQENIGYHPYSYTNIGRYVTKIFDSDANTQAYIDLRAKREIRKMLELEEIIKYNHAFVSRIDDGIPWQGDSYIFRHNELDIYNIYRIVKQSYNLSCGVTVKSQVRRIKLL